MDSMAANGQYPDHGLPEGRVPTLLYGEFLPPDYASKLRNPIKVFGTTIRYPGHIPRIPARLSKSTDMPGSFNPVVSAKFRDVVEQLEPGVHQFIPVTFVSGATGERIYDDTDYFYFNVLTWIEPQDLYDDVAMGDKFKEYEVKLEYYTRRRKNYLGDWKHLVIRRDALTQGRLVGKQIWRTGSVHIPTFVQSADDRMFVRPEVRAAMKAAGVKGPYYHPIVCPKIIHRGNKWPTLMILKVWFPRKSGSPSQVRWKMRASRARQTSRAITS